MTRSPTAADIPAVTELFEAIDATYFTPHPMTRQAAEQIVRDSNDVYLVAFDGDEAVAYGFLRWAGYEVPGLGIAVRRDREGQGWGWVTMQELHRAARERGATRIRLRVHPDNERARRLYDRLGYLPDGTDRGQTVMFREL